jgi:hypothetical protein
MPDQEREQYVTLRELAEEMGLDRSNARKYILKAGFTFTKVRTPESGNQLTLALSREEAEAVLELRKSQGFGPGKRPIDNEEGYFYVIQIAPDLDPLRIKLGFTNNVESRLRAYQTVAPAAKLVKAWGCKRSWERAAIDSITREGCQLIANEVFECENLEQVVKRGEEFFVLMPSGK